MVVFTLQVRWRLVGPARSGRSEEEEEEEEEEITRNGQSLDCHFPD
jgi:hypothetical protein